PMAPPMAAEALGLPSFCIADLVGELDAPDAGITLVEGAGGLLSPLASDGDTRALIPACRPALVVLVAGARLGTIHSGRLCAESRGAPLPLFVFHSRFKKPDDLPRRNLAWLHTREGLDAVTDAETLYTRVAAFTS